MPPRPRRRPDRGGVRAPPREPARRCRRDPPGRERLGAALLAVVLALGASFSYGVGDFLGGLTSRRLHVLTVLALSQLAGAVAVSVWTVVAGEPFLGAGATAAAMAAGVCGAVGLGALYRGMAVGAMGVVAPISSVAAAIPFAYGVSRGERPSALQVAGVVIALAGLFFVSRSPGQSSAVSAGVGLALLAALGFGFYFVFLGTAADDSVPWAVLVARVTSTTLALVAVIAVGATLRTGRALLVPVLAVGICDTSANVLFALASTRGLLSVVSVLTSLYPAITVALAALLLRERVSHGQLAGGAAVLAGAALLTAG